MAAFMTVLESDLRALSAEARRRYPAVKDAAEHAILKLRSLASPNEIALNEDIFMIFVMAYEVRNVKLSVIGLSCLQKLISHDAIAPSALTEILNTLKEHGEMADESIQLKTLQTILIIFQSRLQPDNEEVIWHVLCGHVWFIELHCVEFPLLAGEHGRALGICLRLLENNRSSDSVRNTAAATFRQAVALIFDHVLCAESLPAGRFGSRGYISRTNSVTSDVNRNIKRLELLELDVTAGRASLMRETLTKTGKLGLCLLQDLTTLAAGGSAIWLRVDSIRRSFALDLLEFVLYNYVVLFRTLIPFEQVLRHQICSLLMTSLRTNSEIEGEIGEPYFRRLVLRSVAHVIRFYSSSLTTESEVFLSMLVQVIALDLPLWHRILVLEILRGFCVEARTLRILFQNFDLNPNNSNVVEGMVKALARVISTLQYLETGEESLAAVAGMFSSKAKGIEWSLDTDASNAAVLVASEAHAISLAIEGLLGVVFAVATLTDEAVDDGELGSPKCDTDLPTQCTGITAALCTSMVDSTWLTILDALSLILMKSQGEAIILEILKGYQAFTQACGVLRAVEPLNSFLASLCKFTIYIPNEAERGSVILSPSSKRAELGDQRESIVLTSKNVQALRTLFNIAHRLHNVLGPSWVLVLETLSALDRAIHSSHATTQVLRHQICSLLMTSLRTNSEIEGEIGEPYFRRLVLRSVAHVIRFYSSSLTTESEVFLSMLVQVIALDLPLWHRILVLEILRGFCVEARTLRILFQNFDLNPNNSNVVEGMVKALARVISTLQYLETGEESLAAVAGMFSSKAKGIEWSLDTDASNAAVLVASEAHAISLAIEGLLGVVFAVATLTDEAVDDGELGSPKCDTDLPTQCTGITAALCTSMVDSTWLTILDALSLILMKSQGEAIILEILKGYQAFTQACGVLRAVEPLNSFLASLCKFTIYIPNEAERGSVILSPSSKRAELGDQRESIVLTSKNVQALRTLFNIAHRLHNVLGPSWVLVLETLSALDRAIHSSHATTQEVSPSVPKLSRDPSGQYSDFNVLSSLNSQLFESSALMHVSAVKSLLSALRQLSCQCIAATSGIVGQTYNQKLGSISFSVDRILSILTNNLHRVESLWDDVVGHFLELADSSNPQVHTMALDALDKSICAVLSSDQFQENVSSNSVRAPHDLIDQSKILSLECAVISPLSNLYALSQSYSIRVGSVKILLHVLERHGEKLRYSWPSILEMLRSVAHASEKDLIALGFQSLRVIMNDGLPSVPFHCLHECISVAGAYSTQKTELNISLTAIGLLWIATDFIVKGLMHSANEKNVTDQRNYDKQEEPAPDSHDKVTETAYFPDAVEHDKLLFSVFSLLHGLGADERPEVRNSAIRMLFQTLGSHGQKLSKSMWEDCLWNYVFPMLDHASHLAATSSKDEWQGKELGTRKGKSVHMLIHHSRNTAQKQWDETLGLLLGGITRIFRSFFPFLRSIRNFQSGWESLLVFIKNCILNGSKEVALAAINCLQSTVVSHSLKENFPVTYIRSVLDIYEAVLLKSPNSSDHISDKVKQEILHGLGELYSQAQGMFNSDMYKQLILVVDSTIREAKISSNNFEADYGHVPPVQRTILEILPLLRPAAHLSSLWILLLMKLLHYLPAADPLLDVNQDCTKPVGSGDPISAPPDATFSTTQEKGEEFILNDTHTLFTEKLVPVLVDLFLLTPVKEKYDVFPNVIQSLGRCMTTRRDDPDGTLWRLAVDGFHRILIDDVEKRKPANGTDLTISRSSRIHVWKEVADVYELFLVGHCGRALPSNAVSAAAAACQTAESLEMSILDILGDKILRSDTDIPLDVLQRLISTLDRCASRTCCLPLETVELMPSHCSRFSLACLHKLFCLSSSEKSDWSLARFEVSKISIVTLMSRCDFILRKLLTDEKEMGVRSFPPARMEEVIVVLEELAQLEIHPETASSLHLHPRLLPQEGVSKENMKRRSHLLILFHSFCELVLSRELRVRELVQVLLQLTAAELGLQKLSSRLDEVHDG